MGIAMVVRRFERVGGCVGGVGQASRSTFYPWQGRRRKTACDSCAPDAVCVVDAVKQPVGSDLSEARFRLADHLALFHGRFHPVSPGLARCIAPFLDQISGGWGKFASGRVQSIHGAAGLGLPVREHRARGRHARLEIFPQLHQQLAGHGHDADPPLTTAAAAESRPIPPR